MSSKGLLPLIALTVLAVALTCEAQNKPFKFTKNFLNALIYGDVKKAIARGDQLPNGSPGLGITLDVLKRSATISKNSIEAKGVQISLKNFFLKGLVNFVDKGCLPNTNTKGMNEVNCKILLPQLTYTVSQGDMKGTLLGVLNVRRSGVVGINVKDVVVDAQFGLQSCSNAVILTGKVTGLTFGSIEFDLKGLKDHYRVDEKPTTPEDKKRQEEEWKEKDDMIASAIKPHIVSLLEYSKNDDNHGELYQATQELFNVLLEQFRKVLSASFDPLQVNPTDIPPNCNSMPVLEPKEGWTPPSK